MCLFMPWTVTDMCIPLLLPPVQFQQLRESRKTYTRVSSNGVNFQPVINVKL
jgi:hypothetical protein